MDVAVDSAGNVYEADDSGGGTSTIYKFTSGGTRSTFASGLNGPIGLTFDSAGNLFEADWGSGHIYEFTPGGTRTTFASGLSQPSFLAFQPVPEPSTALLIGFAAIMGRVCMRRCRQ
jgi:DNA-binding beta-propeller fold protein YncE